jgi:hypothetical protein
MGNEDENRGGDVRITNKAIYDEVRSLSDAVLTSITERTAEKAANDLAHVGFDRRIIAVGGRIDRSDTRVEKIELRLARTAWAGPLVSGALIAIIGSVSYLLLASHVH